MLEPRAGMSQLECAIDSSVLVPAENLGAAKFPLPAVSDVSLRLYAWALLGWAPSGTNHHCFALDHVQVDSFEREVVEYVKPNHGTTTLAFIFQGGIIVAVDSRASQSSYICEYPVRSLSLSALIDLITATTEVVTSAAS